MRRADIARLMTDKDGTPQATNPFHRFGFLKIRPRHFIANGEKNFGNPAHAGSSDTNEMDLLNPFEHRLGVSHQFAARVDNPLGRLRLAKRLAASSHLSPTRAIVKNGADHLRQHLSVQALVHNDLGRAYLLQDSGIALLMAMDRMRKGN